MKRTYYTCLSLLILQVIFNSPVFGQASVYSSKRGGVTISIDDTPDTDAKVSTWESNRLLFNKYGYKFNIGLQSEGLSRKAVSDEVKLMMSDGHEMLDHCPQNDVYQFYFTTHLEDSLLYVKNGIPKPGVQSVLRAIDKVSVTLKANTILDPLAIPVLAGRTRLLYRRYLKDSINYPKILAQPGGTDQYISHTDGYIYLSQAGYTGCAYDGGGRDAVIPKSYNIDQNLYHPAFNFKRFDWGDIHSFDSTSNWVANFIAKHQVVSILYHYTNINATYLNQTDQFLKWCQDKNIPVLTLSQWNSNINNSPSDPGTNVFPDITTDLDGDGKPDGFETFYDVTINKSDQGAPGGSSLTKSVGGNFFEVKGLGGIEKGKNTVSFSAKGQVNATIRLQFNSNNISYCDTTITLNSTSWTNYKANLFVPDNVILSNVNFLLNNVSFGNSVSISNIQIYKGTKAPTTRLRDTTITIRQTVLLSTPPGCSNYRWSTGETTPTIVFDGNKSGPGIYPVHYTADDPGGAPIADNCIITVKGMISFPANFNLPCQNAAGTLSLISNIPWTITSKRNLVTFNPSTGITSQDVALTMADNPSVNPVDDTLTIWTSQSPVMIPMHQAGFSSQLSVSKNLFINISRNGTIGSLQVIANVPWKITSKPVWVSVSPAGGNGSATLTFRVDSTKQPTQRSSVITIKAPNGHLDSLSVTITLIQQGGDYIDVDRKTILSSTTAKTETVSLSSNTDWTLTHQSTWMVVTPSFGTNNSSLSLVLQANTNANDRTDTITIKTRNCPDLIVVVTQTGTIPKVYLDKSTVTVSAPATTVTLGITTTSDWTITNIPSWIRASQLSGSGNRNVVFSIDQNKLLTARPPASIRITPLNGTPAIFEIKQEASPPYLNPSVDHIAFGPSNGDTASVFVSGNITWKVINTLSWVKTTPESWISTYGDQKLSITLDTRYFSPIDLTGADSVATFTLEEDSSLPYRLVKTITVTLKSFPAVLSIASHAFTFKGTQSASLHIESNLPWSAEKRTTADWLAVSPSYAPGNADITLASTISNPSAKDRSVYLLIYQTKGVLKDSVLLTQSGSGVGIADYQSSGIKIYPQPARETLNIDLPSKNEFKYWEIYNPAGIEIINGRVENSNKLQIPLAGLAPGLYFITLRSDSLKIGLKFTK